MFKTSMKAALCAAGAVAASSAHADDLLLVDLSVVNQITITATTGLSAATINASDSVGVYFENFYGVAGDPLSTSSTGSGNLTNAQNPSDGSPALFRAGSGSDTGLNIFSWSNDSTVDFTAGSLAFTGSATWALDANEYADMLAGNTTGNLYFPADDASDIPNAVVLGTYRVVPTPGAAALMGLGGIAAIRRRR